MKLSVSRIVGRLIGWLMILFIVLIIMPIGMISSIFSYCFKKNRWYRARENGIGEGGIE